MPYSLRATQIAKVLRSSGSITVTGKQLQQRYIHNVKIVQLHNGLHPIEEPTLKYHGLRLHDFESPAPPVSGSINQSFSSDYPDIAAAKVEDKASTMEPEHIKTAKDRKEIDESIGNVPLGASATRSAAGTRF